MEATSGVSSSPVRGCAGGRRLSARAPVTESHELPHVPWTEEPGGLQATGRQRVRQAEGLALFSLSPRLRVSHVTCNSASCARNNGRFINARGVTRRFLARRALTCPSSEPAKSTAAWGGLQTRRPVAADGRPCPSPAGPPGPPGPGSGGLRCWRDLTRGRSLTHRVCSVWPETGPQEASRAPAKFIEFLGGPLVAGSAPAPLT